MNVLDLFSGIAGGILASQLLGHRTVCAVELDPYCRSVLVRRQNEGYLPPFPIWDDVRTFDGTRWRGIVDVVSGGFPCQNISCAGDRSGIRGEKSSLWFEMLRIIREVRPQYVFVENSNELVRNGLDTVLEGLVESGYDAEWGVLGASDVGAPHIRKRCWILGKHAEVARQATNVANTDCKHEGKGKNTHQEDTDKTSGSNWWKTEPSICRVVDELPRWMERIRGLGNAQVPLCAATAWRILYERINNGE